jgi:hypothetical protein
VKARQLFRYKASQGDLLCEMVIWALPAPTPERSHGLKYRSFCGRSGTCLVRHDNESGKGDHRHYGDQEEPYGFRSVEQLLADFKGDCIRVAGWRWE